MPKGVEGTMGNKSFEQFERELRGNGALRAAANSPEGQRLAERLDGNALQAAMAKGDTEALRSMLAQVLSTPEGRALAEQVQKAVKK